ncbi:MAG: hypothetical protein ABIG20_05560 [archaeon]
MVKIHQEAAPSEFEGTIIDIETIGEFSRAYSNSDSRQYKEMTPVIFGFINSDGLTILCAKNKESIGLLKDKINEQLEALERPFHAYNCSFERGVLYHSLNKEIIFERELQEIPYEKKKTAVARMGIQQYDDPFNDEGKLCPGAWLEGRIETAMAHNRSCLLKERDILLKKGFREPDRLEFVG